MKKCIPPSLCHMHLCTCTSLCTRVPVCIYTHVCRGLSKGEENDSHSEEGSQRLWINQSIKEKKNNSTMKLNH